MVSPIARDRLHGPRIDDIETVQHMIGDTLPRFLFCPVIRGQFVPKLLPCTHYGRSIGFRKTVSVRYIETLFFHRRQHGGGWRRRRRHRVHLVIECPALFPGGIDHHAQYDGGAAEMGYALFGYGLVNVGAADFAQAHVGTGDRGDGPREAPAIAVEHRQCPQVWWGVVAHVPTDNVAGCVEVCAAVMINDTLGLTGGAGRVVQGDGPAIRPRGRDQANSGSPSLMNDSYSSSPIKLTLGFRVVHIDNKGRRLAKSQCRPGAGMKTPCR